MIGGELPLRSSSYCSNKQYPSHVGRGGPAAEATGHGRREDLMEMSLVSILTYMDALRGLITSGLGQFSGSKQLLPSFMTRVQSPENSPVEEERRNSSHKLSSDLHGCTMAHICVMCARVHTNIHQKPPTYPFQINKEI